MGWSRPEYARLAAVIAERTGLTFPPSRQRDMEDALQRALDERTADAARLDSLLDRDTAARDELIASLTIGESYFFRDPAQFALLRDELLPELAARRAHGPLRLWSAGCAAGEEAYSLAILCEELGLHGRTSVLGTDISRTRLAAARQGVYTKWALRGLDAETVERYFTEARRRYTLRPAFRERVDFRYLNLAEDRYPSLTAGIWGFDLILCRNVLIYFDRDTIARVAQRLIASLSSDGWLVLGAADPAISELVDCEVMLTSAGLVYRRVPEFSRGGAGAEPGTRTAPEPGAGTAPEPGAGTAPEPGAGSGTAPEAEAEPGGGTAPEAGPGAGVEEFPESEPWGLQDVPVAPGTAVHAAAGVGAEFQVAAVEGAEPPAPAVPQADGIPEPVRSAYAARDYARAAAMAGALLGAHDTPGLRALQVRALANLGDLAAAGRASGAALERHRTSPELLYLHAVLQVEAGRWREAAAASRRALFLDRSLVVAHLTLALALKRIGDVAGACRSLGNAARLLEALPADAIVPASDGETVGRLRTNVQAQLRLLEGA